MLTVDQYKDLNEIRKRTDYIIDDKISFEISWHLSTQDSWEFFKKHSFIEGKVWEVSSITFLGRVALAAYENNNISG